MFESVSIIWYEEAPDKSGSISLDEDGEIRLSLRGKYSWVAYSGKLDMRLPDWAFDAIIKHKGETRRLLKRLEEAKTCPVCQGQKAVTGGDGYPADCPACCEVPDGP